MKKLKEERKRLFKLYEDTKLDCYLHQEYCLSHFLEMSYKKYNYIIEYCKVNNIKGIVDIGCAMGYQSQLFLNNNIDYVGIDSGNDYFWNKDTFTFLTREYPCSLNEYKNYLAVSVLCLSWNCYLYEGKQTLNKQFNQLSKDFNKCLIYAQHDNIIVSKNYFDSVIKLKSNFYELSNSIKE